MPMILTHCDILLLIDFEGLHFLFACITLHNLEGGGGIGRGRRGRGKEKREGESGRKREKGKDEELVKRRRGVSGENN